MRKIELTAASGIWFDQDSSEVFSSKKLSAGGADESLYHTTKGNWVLHKWYMGSDKAETFTKVNDGEALKWFVDNGYDRDRIPEHLTKPSNQI